MMSPLMEFTSSLFFHCVSFLFESSITQWVPSEVNALEVLDGALHTGHQEATYQLDNQTPRRTHPGAEAVDQAADWGSLTTGPEFPLLHVIPFTLRSLGIWDSERIKQWSSTDNQGKGIRNHFIILFQHINFSRR